MHSIKYSTILFLILAGILCQSLEVKRLDKLSFFEKAIERDVHMNWVTKDEPKPSLEDYNFLMKKCDRGPLMDMSFPALKGRQFNDFTWSSVSQFIDKETDASYILIGGAQRRDPLDNSSVVQLDNSYLLLCKLSTKHGEAFSLGYDPEADCYELPENLPNEKFINLGSSLDDIETDAGHMVVFCDPLYREAESKPKGLCYVKHLISDKRSMLMNNQCSENCMNGFSLAIDKTSRRVNVWSGSPLGNHRGIFQVTSYLPGDEPQGVSLSTNLNIGAYTGYASVPGYVSSPSLGNWTDYEQPIIKLNKVTYSGPTNQLVIERSFALDGEHEFIGFGLTMAKVNFKKGPGSALVVGAPYARAGGVNSGRIYLFCEGLMGAKKETFNDHLDGNAAFGYFGYSLTNMGYLYDKILIGVGQPFLGNETRVGMGRVYLLSINDDCTFDREPYQVLNASEDSEMFGYTLPKRASDLDRNEQNDLVIPVKKTGNKAALPTVDVFFSKKQYEVECIMSLAPLDDIVKDQTVLLSIELRPGPKMRTKLESEMFSRLFRGVDDPDSMVVHQIDPDSNVTDARFKLESRPTFVRSTDPRVLKVMVPLTTVIHPEAMVGIDNGERPMVVNYRFLPKCPSDGGKECDWVKEMFIDWSKCQQVIDITRFVCYDFPKPRNCSSDISVKVVRQEQTTENFIPIVYAMPMKTEVNFLVENHGPDMGKYVQVVVSTFGNLKISSLAIDGEPGKKAIGSDDQRVYNLTLGDMPFSGLEDQQAQMNHGELRRFNLSVFHTGQNFTTPSGVIFKVLSGTKDPQAENNLIKVDFHVVNKPIISITNGRDFVDSIMDNRTMPTKTFTTLQTKGQVDEIGPNLKHIYQIEYMGPNGQLNNTVIRIRVPIILERPFLSMPYNSKDNHLFYLFERIKRKTNTSPLRHDWVELLPKITRKDPATGQVQVLARCLYNEKDLNQKQIIPFEMDDINSRTRVRRSPTIFIDDDKYVNQVDEKKFRRIFQRTPRETFQCGSPGVNYDEPICAEFVCQLPEIQKNRPVDLTIEGWLWARTFFKESIPDIVMSSTVEVSQGETPDGIERAQEPVSVKSLSQTLYFPQIKDQFFHQTPIWPIIVGICAGMSILGIIAAALYRLGFFKRSKRRELMQRARLAHGLHDDDQEVTPSSGLLVNQPSRPGPSRDIIGPYDDDDLHQMHSGLGKLTDPEKEKRARQEKIKRRDKVSILHPNDMSPLM